MSNKEVIYHYLSLSLWIAALMIAGYALGFLTKNEVTGWYLTLQRSPLTPPAYVFPIAWSILYFMIAIAGWIIWTNPCFSNRGRIKILYLIQLLLNWSWTPIFFSLHLTGLSLLVLAIMDICVVTILCLSYRRLIFVTWIMLPYCLWIFFATYLNAYIVY